MRSFLGLAAYYRRFVPGFARVAAPLYNLVGGSPRKTKKELKGGSFEWSPGADEAFTTLKELLTSPPILAYPRFGEDFVVEVDASLRGLGACLSQVGTDGQLHPVAYASRGLRGAEKNYSDFSSFKIELLALKWAVADKFREYLIGSKCTVLTDNNPLAYIQTAKLGATEQRWVSQLAPFDLTIKYRPGKQNRCADALSRCPDNEVNISGLAVKAEISIGSSVPSRCG
ncbi:putative transposon Ty3-I Gag-Pol polyprotein [Apostichopus japonicus]|uniref:Putative transposon Ty3-I Gag-Pol polyprotein n=2 Tax=Stichopus japonicus TaxID=307972 RepID=A0A2G8LC71_STIJA|nr:putative transposon Ty3-I Gag-Pol polyprotein [Apostichopus japonicus]